MKATEWVIEIVISVYNEPGMHILLTAVSKMRDKDE